MNRTLKDSFSALFSRNNVTIWVVGSVLAAAAGPFGSYGHHSFPERFLYWILVFSISTLVGNLSGRVAYKMIGGNRPLLFDTTRVLMIIIVFTPILFFLTQFFVVESAADGPGFFVLAQSVAAISAGIYIVRRVFPGFELPSHKNEPIQEAEPEPTKPEAIAPRLTRRLPDDFIGPILRLAVRDHFVDVVTPEQTHTIRLRFKDAIDEMDSVQGFCTHRSHWVSGKEVVGPERENGRTFLRMSNQDLVPVSRKYKPELEKSGVL